MSAGVLQHDLVLSINTELFGPPHMTITELDQQNFTVLKIYVFGVRSFYSFLISHVCRYLKLDYIFIHALYNVGNERNKNGKKMKEPWQI